MLTHHGSRTASRPDRVVAFPVAALALLCQALLLSGCQPDGGPPPNEPLAIRVATFNLEDIRTEDVRNPDHPRLKRIAAVIQRLRPDVLLLNELAYDQAGAPGYEEGGPAGRNARRFVDLFLSVPQGPGLQPLHYDTYTAPSNTGIASGFDLDNDGVAVADVPEVPGPTPDGAPAPQTEQGRAYGNDAWGFGMFPGQYGMALLVQDPLQILHDQVRTFQHFRWNAMPDALRPFDPRTGAPWHDDAEWEAVRLSSKSHWDVPVALPGGLVLHLLCSHPTPPAFDGPEERNRRRNHDEIRFWADYLSGESYITDDRGMSGGLPPGAPFVLLGDLNADPDEGNAINDPVGHFLLRHPRVQGSYVPATPAGSPDLDPDDTAAWGLRVDYVLPSATIQVLDGGVWRYPEEETPPSDHFPVWIDLSVDADPPEGGKAAAGP